MLGLLLHRNMCTGIVVVRVELGLGLCMDKGIEDE
jgi:hypothetical protein